ncbi:hypothetical protein niasHS_014763 [Heterodera schachtii]|uniref:Ras-related protein Rab-30 n=1 Tax=Heterodera schachtii TaxID=97005 RepID=A0ABD2II92_HETSC
MDDYAYLFKVVLVGNAGVGKTCLVKKFTQGIFPPGQNATIGVDFMVKNVKVDGEKVKLQIWDTAGQERFRSITQSYYRSAHAIVLVYDLSSQPTFDCISEWLLEIEQYANKRALRMLVGNKLDREEEREIPTDVAQSFASANAFHFFVETSAANDANVNILFQEVAEQLVSNEKKQNANGRRNANKNKRTNGANDRTGGRISGILANLKGPTQQRNSAENCCGLG